MKNEWAFIASSSILFLLQIVTRVRVEPVFHPPILAFVLVFRRFDRFSEETNYSTHLAGPSRNVYGPGSNWDSEFSEEFLSIVLGRSHLRLGLLGRTSNYLQSFWAELAIGLRSPSCLVDMDDIHSHSTFGEAEFW